ncbi:antirestriction protein ArdA [Puniceicoccaceae bacterium K14]|nr:antirestriction protein ArdA [Puniceicoccaceae bacterium K14]
MSDKTDTPRIYVACLVAYNAGILHGKWIDADQELDDLWKELREMLAASPIEDAEEWAIHDFEGFGSHRLSEHEGIEDVHKLAEFIGEHGELGAELISHFCGDLEEAGQALENHMGCHKSLADYAEELTTNCMEVPQNLAFYIDYEAMGRDMELSGDVFTIETAFEEVHIFLNH